MSLISKTDIIKFIQISYGLLAQSDAIDFLLEILPSHDFDLAQQELHKIFTLLFRKFGTYHNTSFLNVDELKVLGLEQLQQVAQDYKIRTSQNSMDFFQVEDLSSLEDYKFDGKSLQFKKNEKVSKSLLGDINDKLNIYRTRFDLTKHRILRNETFRAPSFVSEIKEGGHLKITPLKNLNGCGEGIYLILGLLSKNSTGQWIIEDLDSVVSLNLKNTMYGDGIFCDGCLVLCLGEFDGNEFFVNEMSHPPAEDRLTTLHQFPIFKRESNLTPDIITLIKEAENNPDSCFIFASDVWLDDPLTLENLKKLLGAYESLAIAPIAFILMGNFTSEDTEVSGNPLRCLRESFMNFGRILREFPYIQKESHFVFVPGPSDPCNGRMLPRFGFPESITKGCFSSSAKVHFSSNPCRIRYCTQEYVIFRENLTEKLLRNACLRVLEGPTAYHVCNTILSQGCLLPLSNNISPIYWSYSSLFDLTHLPDALILADNQDPFDLNLQRCTCFNPGSFRLNQFQFYTFFPYNHNAERSEVQ